MFKAAGFYGATVEALTLSIEQKCATEKHIADAGLSHAINVHVLDYREMPESFHHAFDAVVSIGVMEHSEVLFSSETLMTDSIRTQIQSGQNTCPCGFKRWSGP